MTGIPKVLYGIATEYWLTSTSYNPHYRIYKSKKIAEKNANKIKEKYSKYGMISLIMKGHFESPEIIESVCKECSRNIKTYIDNISKEQ